MTPMLPRRRRPPARRAPWAERRVIQTAYASGPRDVDARVHGPLAVHRSGDYPSGVGPTRWCVTHVRTGGTIIGAGARATYQQAVRIARECAAAPGVDWDFGSLGKVPRWFEQASERAIKLRAAVRAAGIRAGLKLRRRARKVAPRRVIKVAPRRGGCDER